MRILKPYATIYTSHPNAYSGQFHYCKIIQMYLAQSVYSEGNESEIISYNCRSDGAMIPYKIENGKEANKNKTVTTSSYSDREPAFI